MPRRRIKPGHSPAKSLGADASPPLPPEDAYPSRREIRGIAMARRRGGGGRDTYRPDYVDVALSVLSQGGSLYALARELCCSTQSISLWRKTHPEFAVAVEIGLDMSRGWWEETGRLNLTNRHFNPVLWIMNMHNRFGWNSKAGPPGNGLPGGEEPTVTNNTSTTINLLNVKDMRLEDLRTVRDMLRRYSPGASVPVLSEERNDG